MPGGAAIKNLDICEVVLNSASSLAALWVMSWKRIRRGPVCAALGAVRSTVTYWRAGAKRPRPATAVASTAVVIVAVGSAPAVPSSLIS